MTTDEVRESLSKAFYTEKKIRIIKAELTDIKDRMCRCTPRYTCTPSGNRIAFDVLMDNAILYKQKLEAELNKLSAEKLEAEQRINSVTDEKIKLILMYRYISLYTYEKIATELRMEERQIRRLHKKGLEELAKKF